MDTHPIQITSRRWMIALSLLLLGACVQGLLLWGYADAEPIAALADGAVAFALFAALAYWAWNVVGFVHTSATTLSVSTLVTCCVLGGGFLVQWLLESVTGEEYTPFLFTLPFRLCYVVLLWIMVLLWYRLQISGEEHEEMENQLATLKDSWAEERKSLLAAVREESGKHDEENRTVHPEEEMENDDAGCLDRIVVKDGTKIHLIELPELLCIRSCGDYVTLVTPQREYIKEQTMKYFETHLPEADFVRIHRSAIVQVRQISRLELFGKESYQLFLKNGQKLKVSTGGYRLLKSRLNL